MVTQNNEVELHDWILLKKVFILCAFNFKNLKDYNNLIC